MKVLIILFVLVFLGTGYATGQQNYIPQTGDLLFQDLDCGDFCEAIEKVTRGIEGKDFSHVGIVEIQKNGTYVIEAGGKGVIKTPIDSFLTRSLTADKKPKVIAGRVKSQFDYCITEAIIKCNSLLGKEYDNDFNISNDKYYCSELIYYAFQDSTGNSLFTLAPMTFIDPDDQKTFPAWSNYFKELGIPVPEGEPGLNPGGISRSEKIEIVYSFY